MLQVGKTYSFKTPTFYYIGTVTELWPSHARLSDATEVFETGPNVEYYAGKIKKHERLPDGVLVPLSGGVFIAPYEHVVSGLA
jgi:hypothetical protein